MFGEDHFELGFHATREHAVKPRRIMVAVQNVDVSFANDGGDLAGQAPVAAPAFKRGDEKAFCRQLFADIFAPIEANARNIEVRRLPPQHDLDQALCAANPHVQNHVADVGAFRFRFLERPPL